MVTPLFRPHIVLKNLVLKLVRHTVLLLSPVVVHCSGSDAALRTIFCPAGRLSHEDKAGVANLGPFLFPPAEHQTCATLSIPTIDSSRLLVEFVSGFS